MPTALIEEVLEELKAKYGISKTELERMFDVPFKVARKNIEDRGTKTVHLIHLGTIKPSKWLIDNRHNYVKKDRRDYKGLVQSNNGEGISETPSQD